MERSTIGLPDEANLLAALLNEYQRQQAAGQSPDPKVICRDCPTLLPQLQAMIAAAPTIAYIPDPEIPTVTYEADPELTGAHREHQPQPPSKAGFPQLPNLSIKKELGRGGMGVVYLGRDTNLNRPVAIKMILHGVVAGSSAFQRFLTEAEAMATIDHPNVARVYNRGEYEGLPYFVMEYCAGGSLAAKIKENPLSAREAAHLMEQLARGMANAHERGILHRDLKPDNVLLAADGTPKLTDFGLAKKLDDSDEGGLTQTGAIMGTPCYMAPEQARGDTKHTTPATDVYGLGAMLYRTLTGRPPFLGANNVETMRQVVHDEPVSPAILAPNLSRDLVTICLKCLRKESSQRYATANELAADLRRFLDGKPILARPASDLERSIKWVKRNRTISAAALLVTLSLVSGTVVSYLKYREAKASEANAKTQEGIANEQTIEAKKQEGIALRNATEAKKQEDIARNNATATKEALTKVEKREAEVTYALGNTYMLLANSAYDNNDMRTARAYLEKVPSTQRGFEWYYCLRKIEGGLFTLYGHLEEVTDVAFSPDGKRVLTASWDRTATVWNASTGLPLIKLDNHRGTICSVAYSSDGRRIVTGSWDQTAKIWNAETGNLILEIVGHKHAVTSVAFSPDGRRLLTASRDNTAKLWDAVTGKLLLDIKGHTNSVVRAVFSPDGQRIMTGSYDFTVKIWDATLGTLLLDIKGKTGCVSCVNFSPDGSRIATGDQDSKAKILDSTNGNLLLEIIGHTNEVTSVVYSPDGRRILTGSRDNTARLWDTVTGENLLNLKGHTAPVTSAVFSPDSRCILTGSSDRTAKVWDAISGMPRSEFRGHTGYVSSSIFSPDGRYVLTGSADNTAKIWDANKLNLLLDLKGHTQEVSSVAFSADSRRVLTGSLDKTARIWDAKTGSVLFNLNGHKNGITSVAFSTNSQIAITASRDGTAKLWDGNTGILQHDLIAHVGQIECVAVNPYGSEFAIGGRNKTLSIYNINTYKHVIDITGHNSIVTCAAFSPDGSRIATGSADLTVKLWDAGSGNLLLSLSGHKDNITSVSFSPDGRRLATAGMDKTIIVWDTKSGAPLSEIGNRSSAIRCVSFSPDGYRLLAGCAYSNAKLWDVFAHDWSPTNILNHTTIAQLLLSDNGFFPYIDGDRYRLIPTRLSRQELERRLFLGDPNIWDYRDKMAASVVEKNDYATRYYLSRIISMPTYRAFQRYTDLAIVSGDQQILLRASFHSFPFTKPPYDRTLLHALAVQNDPLAKRLVAQERMRDGKPQQVVPLLVECLLARPITYPPKPPVEELLLAKAYRQMNQPEEAMKWYTVAVQWLDKPRNPMRAVNLVSHAAVNSWAMLGEAFKPIEDPRFNTFDWEAWHECDVFREQFERGTKP